MKIIKIILTVLVYLFLLWIPVWRIVNFGDLVESIRAASGFSKYSRLILPALLLIVTVISFSKEKRWPIMKIFAFCVVALYFCISAIAFFVSFN